MQNQGLVRIQLIGNGRTLFRPLQLKSRIFLASFTSLNHLPVWSFFYSGFVNRQVGVRAAKISRFGIEENQDREITQSQLFTLILLVEHEEAIRTRLSRAAPTVCVIAITNLFSKRAKAAAWGSTTFSIEWASQ